MNEQTKEKWFPGISAIKHAPEDAKDPLVFRHYQADLQITINIGGKDVTRTMAEWLRFALCHWHTACDGGGDPFGVATIIRDWNKGDEPLDVAVQRIDAIFELMHILGIKFWTFHTLDLIDEGANFAETKERLMRLLPYIKDRLTASGIKVLWVTAKLFAAARYMNGAATSPQPDVYINAGAHVKLALDIANALDAQGFVFWGGREGYETLDNTNVGLELLNLATLLRTAVVYKKNIGFKGQFYIEPKAKEPTRHQYDFDVATVAGFLKTYGLEDEFKINFEPNHGDLAGHTADHEMAMIIENGLFGSIDANQGTPTLGWDTDELPHDLATAVAVMLGVLRAGGFTTGGLNFDAKLRRTSTDIRDLIMGFIMAMDTYALALKIAARIINDDILARMVAARYRYWNNDTGKAITEGDMSLQTCDKIASSRETDPVAESAHVEWFCAVMAQYLRCDPFIADPVPMLYPDYEG